MTIKRNGIPVIFTTINQNLAIDKNIKYICSGYDTFTLNSILLDLT